MSTSAAGARRNTRSASKARSETSQASVGGRPLRSNRGRASQRGVSPAAAANSPADDQNQLPGVKQSYGTGGPTVLPLETARINPNTTFNPIFQAVSGAESSNNQNIVDVSNINKDNDVTTANWLAAVDEEEEEEEEEEEGVEEEDENPPGEVVRDEVPASQFTQTPRPSSVETTQTSMLSRFTSLFWAPRHPDQGEDESRTWHQRQNLFITDRFPWALWTGFIKLVALIMAVLLFGFVGYNIPLIIAYFSNMTTFLPTAPGSQNVSNVTLHDYLLLKRRVDQVEQRLYQMPTQITSSSPDNLQQINWFTPGFEAKIDPSLSSPTTTHCDPTWQPWPFGKYFGQSCPQLEISPPHMMALQGWDDPIRERWCAPRSGGKLQLAIRTFRPILPIELVVEYAAKQTSPPSHMKTAPKEIELWIRVDDDDARFKVANAILQWYPELWETSDPQGRTLNLRRNLDQRWVPVGRWIYNIYGQSNVQTLKIQTPLLEFGVSTSNFAVRVNSNWGNVDFSCINRFRMHGPDMSGIVDVLDEEPQGVQG